MNTKNKGYTLIELLVVIGIIGIMVGVSMPGMSQYSKRIAFVEVVDGVENSFREAFSRARSGPFYPLIFIDNTGDSPSIKLCQREPHLPENISADDPAYQVLDGTYFCEPNTYDQIDFKDLTITHFAGVFEGLTEGELQDDFSKIVIEYFPPYGEFKAYTEDRGEASAYPVENSSYAMKSIVLTLSNGIDQETIILRQTGLIERFKGPIEHEA